MIRLLLFMPCSDFSVNESYFVLVMKKMKHRIVEHMSSTTADALGLSRAILCNGTCILCTCSISIIVTVC